jgi:predicted molibdopterin-dependent oxidoreductase YjgC
MTDEIHLTINGKPVQAPAGTTILKAAQLIGISIPTICFFDHCTANAICRICIVEVHGARTLIPSCVATISEGMVVETSTPRVDLSRRTILEMLASSVDLSEAPEILSLLKEYQADQNRFPDSQRRTPELIDDNPMYIRDYEKCILCWRCVQVCADDAQYAYAINFKNRGYHTEISTFYNISMPESTCVFCGQCVGVCPTGALKPKKQWLMEKGYTSDEIMSLTRSERKKKLNAHQITANNSDGGEQC